MRHQLTRRWTQLLQASILSHPIAVSNNNDRRVRIFDSRLNVGCVDIGVVAGDL